MQSRRGYEEKARILSLSIIFSGIILGATMPENQILISLSSLATGAIIILGDSLARTIALLAWGIVGSTTGSTMLPITMLAAITSEITYRPAGVDPAKGTETKRLALIPAFYTPIILIYPVSILPLAAYTLALALDWIQASTLLSRVKIVIPEREVTVAYGEETRIPLILDSNKAVIHYSLLLDGKIMDSGELAGKKVLNVKAKPRMIGVERHRMEVILVDEKARAQRRMGPYAVRIKTTLSSLKAILRIRKILAVYGELIRKPLIYRGIPPRLAVEAEGEEVGIGEEGRGVGEGVEGEEEGRIGEGAGIPVAKVILPVESTREDQSYTWIPVSTGREYGGGRGYRGDYRGVREYTGGDRPTQIHWKKSVSRGELVVKTYEAGGEGGGGGGKLLVVADWVCRNPEELDELVKKTYSAIMQGIGEKYLVLRAPSGVQYFVKGEVPEVLAGLDDILRLEGVNQRLNYSGWFRRSTIELLNEMVLDKRKPGTIARYYVAHARALVSSLKKMGVEEGTGFTMIYSDATALRNRALFEVLSRTYTSSTQVTDVPLDEVSEILRKYLVTYRA